MCGHVAKADSLHSTNINSFSWCLFSCSFPSFTRLGHHRMGRTKETSRSGAQPRGLAAVSSGELVTAGDNSEFLFFQITFCSSITTGRTELCPYIISLKAQGSCCPKKEMQSDVGELPSMAMSKKKNWRLMKDPGDFSYPTH